MVSWKYLFWTSVITSLFFISAFAPHGFTETTSAQSYDYSFRVINESVEITIIEDGSIDIEYNITFINYRKMDGVDIGLPNWY
ncbi:MAG: hypothetical protein JSW28_04285 [Thermoplasmata archaeon]|nr:MAG: hypothetical protein JSW28_04285 [Thermoplasmata archaeon]